MKGAVREQVGEDLAEVHVVSPAAQRLRRSDTAVVRRQAPFEPRAGVRAFGICHAVESCARQTHVGGRERFHGGAGGESQRAARRNSKIVRRHGAEEILDACRQARDNLAEVRGGEAAAQRLRRRHVARLVVVPHSNHTDVAKPSEFARPLSVALLGVKPVAASVATRC